MKKHSFHRQKWILATFTFLIYSCKGEAETWSKPEQAVTNSDNGWIPVQGKCLTCRPNRDLDAQSTNEQIGKVLSPPLPRPQNLAPPPPSPPQFINNKQPRILPFGPNFHQLNVPFVHDNKQFQNQPTKLFPQEGQKQFYQFEGNHFPKQPYSLPQQQLIQAPQQQQQQLIQAPNQQFSQQRFPVGEPYPFTLPLKTIEATTPKINYQPKIRFPDNEGPKQVNNKIPPIQNTDEIQLLYVPVETLQRQRNVKNMKEAINQNQFQQNIPHGFLSSQYNIQYSPIPKPENQFYFPPNFSPPPPNFIQLNPLNPQKIPETIFTNISKNFLQPYFTINGLYSPLPQVQSLPPKQPELQFYNIAPPQILNPAPIKPEPSPLPPQSNRQPNKYDFNNNLQNLQSGFVVSNANSINQVPELKPQNPAQNFESFSATTPEVIKTTEFITERSTPQNIELPKYDFNYQFISGAPQLSASQTQQFFSHQEPKNISKQTYPTPPPPGYDDQNNYPVPHQPPLSFYMEKLHNSKINDVLYLLKDAKTIPVLDTIESEPPQVFVGPSELQSPKGFIKFELPYLSSLDYNRIERMIDRLPFFVAPLNFKPPPGYSKIPFPAPHIGSVVLSNSTVIQESLNKIDQKFKANSPTFSAPIELSTITPQLTSQINSLIESPPPSVAAEVKNYEEVTKKTVYKNTYRPATSTEAPKRTVNRQRKPIFRGYPTTESTNIYETTPTPVTESQKIVEQNKDDYVEFAAKGKFNLASDISPQSPVTYQPSQVFDNSYQSQQAVDNTYPSQVPDNSYQVQQVSTTSQPSQEVSQYDVNNTNFNNYQTIIENQAQNDNPFTKKIASQNADYPNNQNYPFYNFDISSSQIPTEPPVENQNQNITSEAQNFNFNNVKPLSQYNHFIKKEDASPVNITESGSSTNNKDESYQFWNQNQFYKSNPSTVDYFSSTTSHIPETIPVSVEPSITQSRFLKYTTESSIKTEQTFPTEYQKLETQSTEATTSHRPRTKQRLPNRFQSKFTTEKHDIENDSSHKNIPEKVNLRIPIENQEVDSVQQSTENNEATSKVEIKRRRRPIRPTIVTPVTEISSSTSRSYRTRATRYPTQSTTEKYRPRRPTTNPATEAEWNSYVNNFAPSAPASNEIAHEKKLDVEKDSKSELDNYWSEAVSIHQSQSFEVTPSKPTSKIYNESEVPSWSEISSKNSINEAFLQYPTAESNVADKSEKTLESKTERNQIIDISSSGQTAEEVSPTFGSVNYSGNEEHVQSSEDKNINQEVKKDKFSLKDADNQKKAYDPQDEKKIPGRRRGTWVRRIRVKRPQDVFETAESQNLGRITDNSVQILDSKVLSKTEEKDDSDYKIKSSTVSDDIITTTETTESNKISSTSEKDDYASIQNNFAQMLSDFLNSNDQSTKSVNIERTNITSENNISYILGLENKENNSSSSIIATNSPTENINISEEAITTTIYPNSDFSEIQSTTEQVPETYPPNKILGTSTTTEISLETEICYRGKCVKTKKSKASDLLPVE